MARDHDTSAVADPAALAARFISLLPRLALAISQASWRQLRQVVGVDYSLIDYQGVFAATGRFALAWMLGPLRALGAQSELRGPAATSTVRIGGGRRWGPRRHCWWAHTAAGAAGGNGAHSGGAHTPQAKEVVSRLTQSGAGIGRWLRLVWEPQRFLTNYG